MFDYTFLRYVLKCLIIATMLLPAACKKGGPSFECTDAIGCVDIAPGEPIKIAVIQDFSGGAALIGIEQSQSIELALSTRNNQLFGHPIRVQKEDSRCTPEGGDTAALKVVADPQIVAILGTTCSGAAATAAKVMSEAGLVMISGTNSAASLTSIGGERAADWQPGYFRTVHNDSIMGQAAAVFAFEELGVKNAATVDDGDTYTQGLAEMFGQVFTESGGEIVLADTVNKGDSDMRPLLTSMAASEAELVFLPIFPPEGSAIIRQAYEMDELKRTVFMAGGALLTDSFIKEIGTSGVGMYFVSSTPSPESAANDRIVSEYKERYGEPPCHVSYNYAYDAATLLVHAIEAVAVMEDDGTLHIGRAALRESLYAVSDFEGVSGRLSCDRFGDCGVGKFHVVRLEDPAAGFEGLVSNVLYRYTPER